MQHPINAVHLPREESYRAQSTGEIENRERDRERWTKNTRGKLENERQRTGTCSRKSEFIREKGEKATKPLETEDSLVSCIRSTTGSGGEYTLYGVVNGSVVDKLHRNGNGDR